MQLVASPSSVGDKTATEWLESMSEAMQVVPYRGVLRYQQGSGDPTIFRVIRGTWEGKSFERLLHLNEPTREMVRHNNKITFVVNAGDEFLQNTGQYAPTFFDPAFVRLFANLPDWYFASITTKETLAGRSALGIYVASKHQDRYGYRLLVDIETAVLLRFEMLDIEKQSLENFSFIDIEMNAPITSRDVDIQVNSGQVKLQMGVAEPSVLPALPKTVSWQPGWVPEGFKLTRYDLSRNIQGSVHPLYSLVYSDGLAAFSIYIEHISEVMAIEHIDQRGGTVTAVRQARDDKSLSHMVAVVGEVPQAIALKIAQSVVYQDAGVTSLVPNAPYQNQPTATSREAPVQQ